MEFAATLSMIPDLDVDLSSPLLEQGLSKYEFILRSNINLSDSTMTQSNPLFSDPSPESPMGQPLSNPSESASTSPEIIKIVNLLFTTIGIVIAIGSILISMFIALYFNLNAKIDNGFQEIRGLIADINRDYNSRIDATNARIDRTNENINQVYRSPEIS